MKKMSLLVLMCAALAEAAPAHAQLVVNGYTNHQIHGWDVLVNDDAQSNHSVGTNRAVAYLTDRLYLLEGLSLQPAILDSLRSIPIFMEWEKRSNGAAEYHSSLDWLLLNGYIPEKEKAVEISNMNNFVSWSQQNQPWMILHEMAHGYHDRIFGFGDATIYDTFLNAKNGSLYRFVLYNPGNGAPTFIVNEAYALTNQMEYFAEITEAYLGQNDFYPFERSELESYDPVGFALVASIWFQTNSTDIEPAFPEQKLLDPVYPNPTSGVVWANGWQDAVSIRVLDVMGRTVIDLTGKASRYEINLSDQPAGLYLIRLEMEPGTIQTQTVLKTY
ncbi:MAG: T9SS type A sorting domain-containing protein [Bacteroidetes Order II. Incertae sedis bacterium]|jgi:hypothetical protein|nr:T9SS type A sorting domain-containing protein [Bacteroidetes Order II. bacterium]MBT4053320.1 T9SS type A sorting domain-containing protein [Bacteroidetes Order II. bacterium]MBT4602639.1 T9SS type A sorting domain-containing protein [Bacteroidetes Order II. bacterium]MBT5250460.1 T9SS type A sorting domain-containing protein [Bacteroidetes Order II. bacterium]MBT6199802.1 T9SS type A sorting domain-containing protein [Bacteroidetes Order II. bacterium]